MNPAKMTPKQKNAHYGKLNERFDARCGELAKLEPIKDYGTSVFIRRDPVFRLRNQSVPAATVMYADDLVWADHLQEFRGK
jgi:hypothetical protein